jgi:hypothetical protein
MSIGFFAGESWETATQVLGVGGALALSAVAWLLVKLVRGRGTRARSRTRDA